MVSMNTLSAQVTRSLCQHCGLPVGPLGHGREEQRFCCYGCYLAWRIVGDQGQSGPLAGILLRFGIAAVLAMNVMMISLLLYSDALIGIGEQARHMFRWALLGLSAPVLVILGVPFLHAAGRDLGRGLVRMDLLIGVGAVAGFGVSAAHVISNDGHIYFDTATMLLVLVTLGRLMEASARVEASRALQDLAKLKPALARIITDSGEESVPAGQVRVGDKVRVLPGEQVPTDGVIISGLSTVQEAAMTGEFNPRVCRPGDRVYAGSANGEGAVIVESTAAGGATLLSRIERLVRQAQSQRAPIERLADRMSGVFVPVVFALSAGAFGYWIWQGDAAKGGMSALAVLVVACPCSLGIATSLAVCVAIARAARDGALIRTGEALEKLAKVTAVIFDKTGTLTEGKPTLEDITCCPGSDCTSGEALSWLATLESHSEHALGHCIASAAAARGLALGAVDGFRAFPGEGAVGTVSLNGTTRPVLAGTAAFLSRHSVDTGCIAQFPDPAPGETLVFVAWDGQVRARARLADAPRPEAAQAVQEITALGLSVGLLSGDRREACEHLASRLGVRQVSTECDPTAKLAEIAALREEGHTVALVGDGINDAPALAKADVGIAMGGGTDLAREVGDVVLLRSNLLAIPSLVRLARDTHHVIRRNLFWAFGYNLAAIALAFSGYLHPLIAALVMLGSSLFVIQSSLRLKRDPSPQVREASTTA